MMSEKSSHFDIFVMLSFSFGTTTLTILLSVVFMLIFANPIDAVISLTFEKSKKSLKIENNNLETLKTTDQRAIES